MDCFCPFRQLFLSIPLRSGWQLEFTVVQKISLIGLVALLSVIGYTVIALGFYLQELSALFLIWMVITGILNKMSSRMIANIFVEAVEASMFGFLIIGIGMDKWYKFITPLFLMMFALEAIMLVIAITVGV